MISDHILSFLVLFLRLCVLVKCDSGSFNDLKAPAEADNPVIDFLSAGAREGVLECRRQFMWHRWQCPHLAFTEMLDGVPSTKEQAFVHAITSASIVYSITKNCSSGLLKGCSCKRLHGQAKDNFKWEGCSDDVAFPSKVTRDFFESKTDSQVPHAKLIFHNLQAGRIAVRDSLKRTCKCHGLSGSCTTKTCWMELKELNSIGRKLKRSYRRALLLEETNTGIIGGKAAIESLRNGVKNRNSEGGRRSERKNKNHRRLSDLPPEETSATLPGINPRQLVFLDQSPDYCVFNATAVSEGTLGRLCAETEVNATLTKSQRRTCRVMCSECGYEVLQRNSTVTEYCNCKFVWCCDVVCDVCQNTFSRYFCHRPSSLLHHNLSS